MDERENGIDMRETGNDERTVVPHNKKIERMMGEQWSLITKREGTSLI